VQKAVDGVDADAQVRSLPHLEQANAVRDRRVRANQTNVAAPI
jgi:hypothetical protein